MKYLYFFIFLNVFIGTLFAQHTDNDSIYFGGIYRSYYVRVPSSWTINNHLPLVIVLHGHGGTAAGTANFAKFNEVADTAQLLAVYPQGYNKSWADGRGTTEADAAGIDDVGFISHLMDTIQKDYAHDATRTYICGMSNGAIMTNRLGCALSDKVAAIGIVAGSMPVNPYYSCSGLSNVSVCFIHGTADNFVPYGGGAVFGGSGGSGKDGYVISQDSAVIYWRDKLGCTSVSPPSLGSTRVKNMTRASGHEKKE